jgi:hypothetical protein
MKKTTWLTSIFLVLILAGCSSSQSAKYKEAGCRAADQMAYDEAATQFNLAAENGDPEAVASGIASQRIWGIFMTGGYANSLEEIKSNSEYVGELALEIAAYCGSEYDIG